MRARAFRVATIARENGTIFIEGKANGKPSSDSPRRW